jgi:hypothetical protein
LQKILILRATRAHHSVYDGATMAVAMRDSWTDERLDDFRDEVNRRFDGVDKRFDKVDERFDKVDSKMDGLQRTIMLTGGGIIAALLGVIGTQL